MKKTYIKIGFLTLFCIGLPLVSFAQSTSYYYTSTPTPYYAPYQCGTPGTVCGGRYTVQSQSFRPQQTSSQSSFSQTASVASAFESTPAPAPQLPKTGGGGKALMTMYQASYSRGFLLIGAVFVLILGFLSFLVLRKSRENEVSMKF